MGVRVGVWVCGTVVALSWISGCSGQERGQVDPETALQLHRNAVVVDTHADTTPYFQDPGWDFGARHPAETHVDLPRLREGGVDVQFWSIYLPRQEAPGQAVRAALERIDAVHQMAARYPEVDLATTVADIRRSVAAGRLASLMGVEGGHIIEDSLAILRSYQRMGVRYLTLTHSFNTSWADSSGTDQAVEPEHGGLTDFGREVVAELNRLGMMVDVSHVSDETFWDVIRTSRAPIIASHSSCRAVADHPRNMNDDMLRALATNGGVVMINFYSGYIDGDVGLEISDWFRVQRRPLERLQRAHRGDLLGMQRGMAELLVSDPLPRAPLASLLDHFDHALRVAGPDHVGLGADWDGVASMPEGLDDVSMLPNLTAGLLARGHSAATVQKVLGENLLRVMAEVERVAATLPASP